MLCDKVLCTGCRACENICHFKSINMEEDGEGFLRPKINEATCTHCGLCEKACPVLNDPHFLKHTEPSVYACYSRDEGVREASSSGGVFSILAKEILDDGGIVFGAAFDDKLKVCHTHIDNYSLIDDLRRSKYVQSDTGRSYLEAEAFLKAGRTVLYVGTPCQIAGIQGYLKKPYDKLTTCSFVCYGVPSPKVWRNYLGYKQVKHNKKITTVSFRDKQKCGWTNCNMRFGFEDESEDIQPLKQDAYFIGFGRGLFTRPSCFDCRFRYTNSKADIILADFWGVDKLDGIDVSDDKGVSLVLTNTEKAEKWINKASPYMFVQKRTFEEASKCNPRLVSSSKIPKNRARFFKKFKAGVPFDRLVNKYMRNTGVKAEAKKLIKAVLGENLIKRLRG